MSDPDTQIPSETSSVLALRVEKLTITYPQTYYHRYFSQTPHIRLRLKHLHYTKPTAIHIFQEDVVTAMFRAYEALGGSATKPEAEQRRIDQDLYEKEKAVWEFMCEQPLRITKKGKGELTAADPTGTEVFPGQNPNEHANTTSDAKVKIEPNTEDIYANDRAESDASRSSSPNKKENMKLAFGYGGKKDPYPATNLPPHLLPPHLRGALYANAAPLLTPKPTASAASSTSTARKISAVAAKIAPTTAVAGSSGKRTLVPNLNAIHRALVHDLGIKKELLPSPSFDKVAWN